MGGTVVVLATVRRLCLVLVVLSSSIFAQPRYDSHTLDEDPKFTELDLPASERNTRLVYIPAARAPWAKHIARKLSDRRLLAQKLYPGMQQNYTLTVPLDGNMAITVHPRRGFITWNVTYLDIKVMVHPFFVNFIHQNTPLKDGKRPVQAMPGKGKSRQKRCCIAGAVTFNYDFDVVELDAGLGKSLGPGSITYFKEDVSGGVYTLWVKNGGDSIAEFVVYATRRPEYSPFPRIHYNDPQIKITDIGSRTINVTWMKAPESPNVTYCIVYHSAGDHRHDDVHSSSFATWMERPSAVHLPCTKNSTEQLKNLRPNTEYHIDLLAHNLKTLRETTFMGVVVRTKPSSGLPSAYDPALYPENPPPDGLMPPLDTIHDWVPVLRNISAIYYPPQWQRKQHIAQTSGSSFLTNTVSLICFFALTPLFLFNFWLPLVC